MSGCPENGQSGEITRESDTVELNTIKTVLLAILFLGIFPYMWYRDQVKGWMSLIGFTIVLGIWIIFIIQSPWPKKIGYAILAIGASCNQIAIWANGGKMPVKDSFIPHGLWRPMVESDRVKFLCDIYWHSTSIGDLIALSAVAFLLILSFIY